MIYQLDNTALMYIATKFVDGTAEKKELSSIKGELLLSKVGEAPSSDKNVGTRLTFQYRGPKDTVLRSVIFDSNIVKYAKLTKAEDMRIPLKSVKISAGTDDTNTTEIDESLANANFDYMLRISMPQSFSLNPNEVLIKDVVYHAKSGDTTGHIIAGFVYNLVKSQNEYTPWKVFIGSDEITKTSLEDYKSIYEYAEAKKATTDFTIKAVWNPAIEWQLKYKEVQVPEFFVSACILGENADYDIEEGGESDWIKIEKLEEDTTTAGAYVPNGYETANREMWYLVSNGTQNDQDSCLMYRSETMVDDPLKEYNYINIHVTENSEHGIASGMNEKDIIIASTEDLTTVKTALEEFGIKFKA